MAEIRQSRVEEMERKKVTFRISRFRPGTSDPKRFQIVEVEITQTMTVLDCLDQIRTRQDPTLMYGRSCHHASCGTCACRVNGTEMLACTTRVWDLEAGAVTLEPLANVDPIGDLALDMNPFFKALSKDWHHVRASEGEQSISTARADGSPERFEACIECGACYSACPVIRKNPWFIGPAVLAALHREYDKTKQKEVLAPAAGEFGASLCERAINCSRVCPAGVYPARRISDIRRLLEAYPAEKC